MSKIKANRFTKKVAENMMSGKPKALGLIAKEAGYGSGYQNNPGKLLRTRDVASALAKVGITPDTLSSEWEKVLKAEPDPDKPISWDSKIKGLAHISEYVFDKKEKFNPQVAFISKFINLRSLGRSVPKNLNREPIIENDNIDSGQGGSGESTG